MSSKKVFIFFSFCIFTAWLMAACTPVDNTEFPPNSNFRHIGDFYFDSPAYLFFDQLTDSDPEDNLIVNSFKVMGTDSVSAVRNIEAMVISRLNQEDPPLEPVIEVINSSIMWPNETQPVPAGIFGFDAATVAGGFLIPWKSLLTKWIPM